MATAAKKLSIFPTSWRVAGRDIIIVGGGEEALAKARLAVKTQARVKVIAREFHAGFAGLDLILIDAPFVADHLANAALVFVADDGVDGAGAIGAARVARVALNVVDQPELCDFYTPAIIDRAPVSIAISSEGEAPVLARILRAKIETVLSLHVGALALLAGSLRDRVADILPNGVRRRRFFEALATSSRIERVLAKGVPEARREAIRLLDSHAESPADNDEAPGIVWLIGAGPGAQDLLTLRALRLLQEADVIIHDDDVSEDVIQMGRRDAGRIISAAPGPQLAELVARGKKVVWLVDGDVSVASVDVVAGLGLAFQIVPGVGVEQGVPLGKSAVA